MRLSETALDRYPAKMVGHLAESIVRQYASDADLLCDPFCGSGAVLSAATSLGIEVIGIDVNPYAILLASVKLAGFDARAARVLFSSVLGAAEKTVVQLPLREQAKYWFPDRVLRDVGKFRRTAHRFDLASSDEGRAVLLSLALSARLCSKADQRSPKPFISKMSRSRAVPDLGRVLPVVFEGVCSRYTSSGSADAQLSVLDVVDPLAESILPEVSHVVTSPPYLNAQDYFRNSLLELLWLEGLIDFDFDALKGRFLGTERAIPSVSIDSAFADFLRDIAPPLVELEQIKPTLARVAHAYFYGMSRAAATIRKIIRAEGRLVTVCGDNLLGGERISTWKVLEAIFVREGFVVVERFEDEIRSRSLAPKRSGHRGLIKREVISVMENRS